MAASWSSVDGPSIFLTKVLLSGFSRNYFPKKRLEGLIIRSVVPGPGDSQAGGPKAGSLQIGGSPDRGSPDQEVPKLGGPQTEVSNLPRPHLD